MNALIKHSEEARAKLLHATGIDELTYHLLILECGCQCLDDLVRPVGTISQDARDQYRNHLGTLGWWTWYEMQWRVFEIRLEVEWFSPNSLVSVQPKRWKRERLITEARTLRYTEHYAHSFDLWMKMIEDHTVQFLPPLNEPKTKPIHEHIH